MTPVLLFSMGGEHYAMDLSPVEAILPDRALTAVPMQPGILDGFFEWQGECIPALSLHRLLGAGGVGPLLAAKILIVRHLEFRVALRVDAVIGTREVEDLGDAASFELDGQNYVLLHSDSLIPQPVSSASEEA